MTREEKKSEIVRTMAELRTLCRRILDEHKRVETNKTRTNINDKIAYVIDR